MDKFKLLKTIILSFFPITFLIGLFSNSVSLYIYSKRRFKNTSLSIYFRYLNIVYLFCLSYMIIDFMNYQLDYNLETLSVYSCKIVYYYFYVLAPNGSWILVIISLNAMLSVLYPTRFKLIRTNKRIQISICIFMLFFNFVYYIEVPILQKFIKNELFDNETNSTVLDLHCESNDIIYWMDLVNSTCLPSILMITFSSITISFLLKSRLKISKRDIKFVLFCILLNISFLMFNLPIIIYGLVNNYLHMEKESASLIYIITVLPYYAKFSDVFYISIIVNIPFRKELMKRLKFFKL
jgi:hypothetical protein